MRELLARMSADRTAPRAAAFDTRLASRFSGGAARRLARALHRAGAVGVGRPMELVVTGMAGPLRDGELDRARAWGRELGGVLATPAQGAETVG